MNRHGTPPPHPGRSTPSMPPLSDLLPWHAWVHDRRLRTPAVALFAALVTVPTLGALIGDDDADTGLIVFALYFAAAWYLLLRAIIRPQQVTGTDVLQVVAVAVVVQKPLALAWNGMADVDSAYLFATTFGTALPEELLKLLPVAAIALLHRGAWRRMAPRDLLFLGMVSGLAFGTGEAIFYVTENYASAPSVVYIWRLVDGPIAHACWAGISCYFLGLALRRRGGVAAGLITVGLAVPAVLHGLNNWDPVNGSIGWVAIALVSGLLVLGYATVGVAAPTSPDAPMVQVWPIAPAAPIAADPVTERLIVPAQASVPPQPRTAPRTFVGPDGRWWG